MVDHYGRKITYMRVSVTELCNLRCRYCMPADGVCKKSHSEMMTEDETIMSIRAAAEMGIEKIRITGGEPLVKKNILSICERTANVPGINSVCITTNGVMLPELAVPLKNCGVNRVNISIDTLNEERYRYITRVGELKDAIRGVEAALDAGFDCVKINAVLIGGFNDSEIPEMVSLTKKYPVDMRFIELMPMYDGGEFGQDAFIKCSSVLQAVPELEKQDDGDGVARLYKLPDGLGRVGLISPVSDHFCAKCNRIRLTADGKLKPCLHSSDEFSIKGLAYDGIKAQIAAAIGAKPQEHEELTRTRRSHAGRNMNQIGG